VTRRLKSPAPIFHEKNDGVLNIVAVLNIRFRVHRHPVGPKVLSSPHGNGKPWLNRSSV
jgi:hypothetical protein